MPRYYSRALGMAARELALEERYRGRAEPLSERVAVTLVLRGSPAAAGQLAAGDFITSVNNRPVKNVAELAAVLEPLVKGTAPINFMVLRNGTPQVRIVTPKAAAQPK